MVTTTCRRFFSVVLLVSLISVLLACGGGGGGDKNVNPPVTTTPGTTSLAAVSQAATSAVATSTATEVPPVITTLTLGAPTSNPIVIPPSPTGVPIKFLSVVRGTYYPDQLIMDEVDKNGVVVQPSVAQLKDDGVDADAFRGDRTYSGQLVLSSVSSQEKFYRVRADHKGVEVSSGTGRFWVSGCPSVARPSNPERAVLDPSSNSYVFANEMLVTLADTVPPDLNEVNAIMADVQGQVVGCIPALRQYLVEIAGSTTSTQLFSALTTTKSKANVVDATPNALVLNQIEPGGLPCNGLACQWYLERIRAPQAWAMVGGGDEQSSVAVIDFGVNCTNSELNCKGSIYSEDTIDHGTGVASLIGARKEDGTALVGVAWNTELYPFSFIGKGGSQYKMSELITLSMAEENIRVINISAATATDPGNQIRDAMCSAIDSGRLIVAAAGNASTGNDCKLENVYPARYNSLGQCANGADLAKGLLVIGATDADNNLAQWEGNTLCSNTLYVDIFAPGKDIYAASATNGGYASKNGTSFSAPLVAGSAAVLWSAQPELTVAQIHDKLVTSSATFSLAATITRTKTTDIRLDGKHLVDLFAAVGGKENQPAPDLIPDAFSFINRDGVDRNTDVKSDTISITGIDSAIPVDVKGGFYSINDGPFTSAAGTVGPNQKIVLQLRSANAALTATSATLVVGGISKNFQVTTAVAAAAQLPDRFDFFDVSQAQLDSLVLSNTLRIAGIASATSISIVGGEYAIDGGAFTSQTGTVNANQDIQLRATAAATPNTRVTAIVSIGGVADNFHVTTKPVDTSPDPFTFTDVSNANLSASVTSNTVTVQGINSAALISISGGEYSINGGTYKATAANVEAGQTVQVRHKSANSFGSDSYTTLTIGGYSAGFHSRTLVNVAPVATNSTITDANGGNAEVGDILTGTYTYTDADSDPQGISQLRWLRSGVAISSAVTANYTITTADIGKDIQFEVTPVATTGVLTGVAKTSAAITSANSAPKASNIVITDTNGGALAVGDSLTASYTYQDADNDLQGISTYRWLRNGVAISGANTASYQVTSTDSGKSLAVEIIPVALTGKLIGIATLSGTVILGNSAPQATGVIVSGANAGKSIVGASLTGAYTFTDVDADLEGISLIKWLRNGTAIPGATAQSYSVTTADNGQIIAFEITPIAASGTTQGAVVRSGNVTINAIPTVQTVAIVDNNGGTLVVGDTLTGTYTYTDAESDAQGASKYRWLRNGTAISGATTTTYVLIGTDSGQNISFEVTPQAATGSLIGIAAQSLAVAINNSAPVATTVMLVDANGGSAANGDLLNGSYTYSDSDGDSQGATTFRWLRNGTVTIGTAQSYSLTAADSGQTIQFSATPRASTGIVAGAEVASGIFTVPLYIPTAFTFTSVTNAALNTATTSNLITLSGINTPVAISITGGQYSLNGGVFTSAAGTVTNGQTVSVRVTSSASPSALTQAVLTIGGVTGSFSVSTGNDTTPDAFSFNAVTGAVMNSSVTSNAITISGINTATPISITNGQYSIAGGAFTSAAGTVTNGQTMAVKVTASATPNTATQAVLTIGGVAGTFSATTVLADTTPDAFSFTAVTGAALNSSVTSPAITISGINAAAPISITNGQYSIAGGAFTSAAGTVTNGQTVAVKVTASATPNTATQAVLTVGGVAGTFSATTVLADTTPDAFSFTAVTGAALNSSVTSTAITISGINAAAPISITNGQYSIAGGPFTSAAGTVTNGQTVTVNVTASATPNTATQAVLTIGGVAGTFSATTVLADTTPDAFSFTSVSGAALSSSVTSAAITISGINSAAPISITNGQYSIAGGAFTSAAGTVTNGQTVTVKVTASAIPNTATQAILTVGGVAGTFSATTVLANTTPDAFSFTAVTGAALSSSVTSTAITISGINTATPISITNGQYSIAGGAFTSAAGTVTNGQTVAVKVTASATPNTATQAVLTVGGVAATFSATTVPADTTPDAFGFTAVTGAVLNSSVDSNAITISGINSTAPISITNGQYSIAGGAFTSAAGTVTNGQTVVAKVTASATPNTAAQAVLTVGGVVGTFTATTVLTDTTPDVFSFTAVTGAALNSSVTSNAITISGINNATPISITNGQYSIAGGAFTSAAGTVTNGQTVTVSITASATPNTATQAELTVGGVAATFSATTVLADSTPDAFNFTAVTGAALNSSVISSAITISGINTAAPISIANGQYSISGGAFTSAAGMVINGQTVAVKLTASATPNTATQAVLSVGSSAGNFSVTTVLINTTAFLMGGAIQGTPLNIATVVTTLASTAGVTGSANGTGVGASFHYPRGITTDGSTLYIADYFNHTIRKIVIATGEVTTLAGTAGLQSSTDGTGVAARFNYPKGITTDGTNLYIADSSNKTIRKIAIESGSVTTLAGTAGVGGNIDGPGATARFWTPTGITSDGTNLYVTDKFWNSIRKIVIATGVVTTLAGSGEQGGYVDGIGVAARFYHPSGVTTDGINLYVTDTDAHTIRKIVIATGVVTTYAGMAGIGGNIDGIGASARFNWPEGITTDGTNLYVADTNNRTIRKIVIATGSVTTLVGTAGIEGSTDGVGAAALFKGLTGISTDGFSLFVTDSGNNTIRKVH